MNYEKFFRSVVYPIPPAFKNGRLETGHILRYLSYLYNNGARVIMTTAGTSKHDLMSENEIHALNEVCYYFSKDKDDLSFICGMPKTALWHKMINMGVYSHVDALMFIYPDRYYNNDHIVDYFCDIADIADPPIMIHGLAMRHGKGGIYQYTPGLVKQLKNAHRKIIGMKEESLDFDIAYKVSRQADDEFVIIVAGKSARRYTVCGPAGAQTYLSGIGSFFPEIEERIFEELKLIYSPYVGEFLRKFEDPLFWLANKYGWHLLLETGQDG
jgi:dihydrodipicolinate synthase/N-acetylneuraminate lyase